jgi:molybdopterin-guanine dinucleotide biosynthesis protein A
MLYPNDPISVTALILAGGKGSRLGGIDKGWQKWRDRAMIEQVLERLRPQAEQVIISCNRNLDRYQTLGELCITDENSDFQGPLAGVLAASRKHKNSHLLLCPCDTPMVPTDLRLHLQEALAAQQAEVAIPVTDTQPQYAHALINSDCTQILPDHIQRGQLALKTWLREFKVAYVDFSNVECFRNINTPADLE